MSCHVIVNHPMGFMVILIFNLFISIEHLIQYAKTIGKIQISKAISKHWRECLVRHFQGSDSFNLKIV